MKNFKSPVLSSRSPVSCPHCFPALPGGSPAFGSVFKIGSYQRKSDSKRIARFLCRVCNVSFSHATFSECYRQRKRRLNRKILLALCSGVSQRRIARLLKIDLKTVARKLVFLAETSERANRQWLLQHTSDLEELILEFDEMESSVHSKCLPVSIPLLVQKKSRKIFGFRVCEMPAKGMLAQVSRQKYGPRKDLRAQAAADLFGEIGFLSPKLRRIESDRNPKYPGWIRRAFPGVPHVAHQGKPGCITGQGELKKTGFDPLFAFNQTAAMLRANINRLFRKTWCTSKRMDRLAAHIELYVYYHNTELAA